SVHAAANRDVRLATSFVAPINANGRAKIEIRNRFRFEVRNLESTEINLEIGCDRASEFAPEGLGLAPQIVLRREKCRETSRIGRQLLEQRLVDVIADADA